MSGTGGVSGTGGEPARRLKVLLVSSSGGVLLDLLALEPWWSRHRPAWALVPAPDTTTVLPGHSIHWVREPNVSNPVAMLPALLQARRVLRRERPDVIVSAGTGCAVPFFALARLRRIPAIWLSTFNLMEHAGVAARICGRLAAAVLVPRESMLQAHPGAIVIGELY